MLASLALRRPPGRPAPAAPGGEGLSSAILYAAIIAIWAGVLIPRWLRRDSSASSAEGSEGSEVSGGQDGGQGPAEAAAGEEPRRTRRRGRRRGDLDGRREDPDDRREVPPDQVHRRVVSGRRRLLGLLLVLAAGSGALAGTRMAAWWVVVPSAVMLLGYLPLLRAAAKADAERRELAEQRELAGGGRTGRDRAADHSRGLADPEASVAHVTPVRGAFPVAAAPGPAPVPAQAEVIDALDDDEIYDQYMDAKLRAVGD